MQQGFKGNTVLAVTVREGNEGIAEIQLELEWSRVNPDTVYKDS